MKITGYVEGYIKAKYNVSGIKVWHYDKIDKESLAMCGNNVSDYKQDNDGYGFILRISQLDILVGVPVRYHWINRDNVVAAVCREIDKVISRKEM